MADGIRVRRLTLFGAYGSHKSYEVDFTRDGSWRPLSIIAGRSATGKTSVFEYILYCLGDDSFPSHDEMRDRVASAILELELNGENTRIERTTSGSPSKFASIWTGLPDESRAAELRLTVEPPSDPDNLSQFLMRIFGLGDIRLPLSQSRADTTTHTFTIRDVMRLFHLPNSRLDNKNLVFEEGNPFVTQKFSQAFDLAFDVADSSISDLADRLRAAEAALREAEANLSALQRIVTAEYPEGAAGVDIEVADVTRQVADLHRRIQAMDAGEVQRGDELIALRSKMLAAKEDADGWAVKVRDRQSLVERLDALRLDYLEDLRKLKFLRDAERIFDPFHISICPACLTALDHSVLPVDGTCGLCGNVVDTHPADPAVVTETIEREGRSVEARLDALVDYLDRLASEQLVFQRSRDDAEDRHLAAAAAVEATVTLPAPFLAARDSLAAELAKASGQYERHSLGARLWGQVAGAEAQRDRLAANASRIRKERGEVVNRPDRASVIHQVSTRFASVLADFGYPKLSDAYIDSKLQPHVRGHHYSVASSGGLTLISLAWYLSVWEIGFELDANLPGLLMIDSPEKNLGAGAGADPEFSDLKVVESFYRHVTDWLAGAGAGAQVIIVDNTPPVGYSDDVVVRFSGQVGVEPFGLISDATS